MSSAPSDEQRLLRSLRNRAPGAFEELLDLYEQPVYRFVHRLLDDPSDAPDVTQEVFIKIFRGLGDFRAECSLKTWVYRIAVREAANRRRWFFRHRRKECSIEFREDENGFGERLADSRETPFEAVRRRERREIVAAALRQLDERLRAVVVMRDLEGISYQEIAQTLGVPLGTVKSRILRGREALKVKLKRQFPAEVLDGLVLQAE